MEIRIANDDGILSDWKDSLCVYNISEEMWLFRGRWLYHDVDEDDEDKVIQIKI